MPLPARSATTIAIRGGGGRAPFGAADGSEQAAQAALAARAKLLRRSRSRRSGRSRSRCRRRSRAARRSGRCRWRTAARGCRCWRRSRRAAGRWIWRRSRGGSRRRLLRQVGHVHALRQILLVGLDANVDTERDDEDCERRHCSYDDSAFLRLRSVLLVDDKAVFLLARPGREIDVTHRNLRLSATVERINEWRNGIELRRVSCVDMISPSTGPGWV